MKFAIISDTHDHIKNFLKVIEFLNAQNITTMLHCGDICNLETIAAAQKAFAGQIVFVRGNGDSHIDHGIHDTEELNLGGKRVAIIHYPELARKLAESGNYDLVFYGHTHKPWLDRLSLGDGGEGKAKECLLVNPGELAGQRYKPCFALYDTETDKLELKILEKLS